MRFYLERVRPLEDGGLVRWTAGVGTVINGVFSVGDFVNGKNREAFDFVVITSVIAVGPFVGKFAGGDMAFQNKFQPKRAPAGYWFCSWLLRFSFRAIARQKRIRLRYPVRE